MWYILSAWAAEPWGDVKPGEQFDPAGWHCDKETCLREATFGGIPLRVNAQICQGRAQEISAAWSVGAEHETEIVGDYDAQAARADIVQAALIAQLQADGYTQVDQGDLFGAKFTRWKHDDQMRTVERKEGDGRVQLALIPGVPVPCGTPGVTTIDVLPKEVSEGRAVASLEGWAWGESRIVEHALREKDPPPGWHIAANLQSAADSWPKSVLVAPAAMAASISWETWGQGIIQTGLTSVRTKTGDWRVIFKAPTTGIPSQDDAFDSLAAWADWARRLPAESCAKIEAPDRETMTALSPRMGKLWTGVLVDMTEAQRRSCSSFSGQHPSSTSVSVARETFRVYRRNKTLGMVEVQREADGSRTLSWSPSDKGEFTQSPWEMAYNAALAGQ